MALQMLQRLLQSSAALDTKLEALQSCMHDLQGSGSKDTFPSRVMTQANFIALSFCSRSLCSIADDMPSVHASRLWQMMRQAAFDKQASHAVTLPFSIVDAAAKSVQLATAQGAVTCLADCNEALRSLKDLLRGCPASHAIKMCTAALHALAQDCDDQVKSEPALTTEVVQLLEFSLHLLRDAEGIYRNRSWQLLTTTFVPAAIMEMWIVQSSHEQRGPMHGVGSTLRDLLQAILSHPDHLVPAANEFMVMVADHAAAQSGTGTTAATGKKQQKQYHAKGVLAVWQLVEDLASGRALLQQETRTLGNVHHYFAWLIRTYHHCHQHAAGRTPPSQPVQTNASQKSASNLASEAVCSLPWNVLCTILHRSMEVFKRAGETEHSQNAACISLDACAEGLQAAQYCHVYRPTEDTDGQQRAELGAVVQALQSTAEQLTAAGIRAQAVKQAMAKVLARLISMEHRCIADQMDFVFTLMWEAAAGDSHSSAARPRPANEPLARPCLEPWPPVAAATEHGSELLCSILEAFAALRRLDTLLPTILSSAVSAWTPSVDAVMRSASAQAILRRTVNTAPSAQVATLVDALCATLQLSGQTSAPRSGPVGTIAHVGASVLCALRAEPQQAAAGAAAAQRLVSAAQGLAQQAASQAGAGDAAASCAVACLPLLQLQAGVLHLHDACAAHDPALDGPPPVIVLPARLLQHLPSPSAAAPSSPPGSKHQRGVCLAERLATDAHGHKALEECALGQLARMAAAGLASGRASASGHAAVLAHDAAVGGAACCAWLGTRLHDDHMHAAHSLSCASGAKRRAISAASVQLAAAVSSTAALEVLAGLPVTHAGTCAVHMPRSDVEGGNMLSNNQAGVLAPLLRSLPQWLPQTAKVLQQAIVKACIMASADPTTAEQLRYADAVTLVGPAGGLACGGGILSSKVASKAWPAAFVSVARSLQLDFSEAVTDAVTTACWPCCGAAQHVMQVAQSVTRPTRGPQALPQLMQHTAGMLSDHSRSLESANDVIMPAKARRGTLSPGSTHLAKVVRCTRRLLGLVDSMDVDALAAFAKKRKWALLARSLIAIICTAAAGAVMAQGAHAWECLQLQSAVLVRALQQLAAVTHNMQQGAEMQVPARELLMLVSACVHVCVWSDCSGLEQACTEVVQQVATHALANNDCQGLVNAWHQAHTRLAASAPGAQSQASPHHRGSSTASKPAEQPEVVAQKKRKRLVANGDNFHQTSRPALPDLLLLNGLISALLPHVQEARHAGGVAGLGVLVHAVEGAVADMRRLSQDGIARLRVCPDDRKVVDMAGLLLTLSAGCACCIHWARRTTSSQGGIQECIQDCKSAMSIAVQAAGDQNLADSGTASLQISVLQAVDMTFLALQPQPGDSELQDDVSKIQRACLLCMSSDACQSAHLLIPVLHPTYRAASNLFIQSLSACSSGTAALLVKQLLHSLSGSAASALAALSALLLLLECNQRTVQQCMKQSMPVILRAVVQCMAIHPLNSSISKDDLTESTAIGVRSSKRRAAVADVVAVHVLALRSLESMLGQKALFSTLGAEGTRLPLTLVDTSRQLSSFLRHNQAPTREAAVTLGMMLLAGVCSVTIAMLRHREDLAAMIWPLLASVVRLEVLVEAASQLQPGCGERCHDALRVGSQAIASVYEAAADSDRCEGCRHILLRGYVTVVSHAQEGQHGAADLVLPASSMERLRQGAVHLVGSVSDAQMQHLHVSLERHTSASAQERLASLKRTYETQQKFSGKV
eukprot:jgi/Ulvmu1/5595/UM023_0132.1